MTYILNFNNYVCVKVLKSFSMQICYIILYLKFRNLNGFQWNMYTRKLCNKIKEL